METLLILAAAFVAVLALAFVWILSARDRRPPLRTRMEEELGGGDPEAVIASVRRRPRSPIDRDAPILEITSIEKALVDSRLIANWPGDAQAAEGRVIEGEVIEEQAVEGQAADTTSTDGRRENETKARQWKAAETESAAAKQGPASR